jgi:phage terminase large subunit-like protein
MTPGERMKTTPSPPPDIDLKLSPEVAWFLESRGIPTPDCPPLHKTPEPVDVPGARFDPDRVDRVLRAFSLLRHTQGEWAGRPLIPDPWQVAYVLAPVFGWVRRDEDGRLVRIVRSLYVDVPRKNGKSTLSGGIAVYLTAADGEHGAQVLAAATTQQQAGYVFDPVRHLCQNSPALKSHIKAFSKRIVHPASGSYFAVVSSVAEALHGANVHGAIIDELHVHANGELVETIETGTGSRRQPLVAIITTADDGRQGTIYARKRERVERLARGTLTDPTTYGVVWAAEVDDDPFAEETWRKANPGFGISPTRAYLASAASEAQDSPAKLATFLRLHLGLRTKQETRYFELDAWDRNAGLVDEAALRGRRAYGGLDLAATSDLTALAWVFPDGDGGHDVLVRGWLPERAFEKLNERTAGAAEVWRRAGHLRVTPGDVADYDYIRAQINADRETFDVAEIGYDPWNATQLVNDLLADEAPMVAVRQGFGSMSAPTKDLLRLLLEGTAERPRFRHGGNPALRWQADNFAVEMDAAGNVKPSKRHAGDKIDGIVGAIIALSRAMHDQPPRRSAYEDRDLEVV